MKKDIVKDWMTSEVITIGPDTTLPDAHQLMMTHKIRRLPVVEDNGRLIGIITLGDVRGAEPSSATSLSVWELNYLLAKLTVNRIMSKNPIAISPDATIGEAARLMLDHKISSLPVTNTYRAVVGIITESDIFRMLVRREWGDEQPDN